MKKQMLTYLLFILSLGVNIPAKNLNELKINGKAELVSGELISSDIRDKNGDVCSGLIILSDLDGLSFDSNNGIVKIDSDKPGKNLLFLSSNERVVTVYKGGFSPFKIILNEFGIRLKSGEVWQLKITGDKLGVLARADENLVEVIFEVDQDSVYSSYGSFTPTLQVSRTIAYKLPKGEHAFKFQKAGYNDELRTVNVEKPVTERITFIKGASTRGSKLNLPGIIIVQSEPVGSEVIINGQKIGNTPLQMEWTTGNHHLELRKPLYYPEISSFTLEEGKTKTLNIKLKPRFGYLSVRTNQPRAKIYLDGKLIVRNTVQRKEIESSQHKIRIEHELYHTYTEEFVITDGEEKNIYAELKPAFGSLELTSSPESGADVYLDSNFVGKTPLKIDTLLSTNYSLKVTKNLFNDVEEEIVITDGKLTSKNILLGKNFGELKILSDGSSIYIDNKLQGRDKYLARLAPGKYKIKADKGELYIPAEHYEYIKTGDVREIKLNPEPRLGGLSVIVEPYEASDAEIFIGNESKGKAPYIGSLLIGNYIISATKDNYLPVEQNVYIKEGEKSKITFSLYTYEGSRLQTANKWGTVKWISLGLSALSGGAAYYFNSAAGSNFDKYKSATTTAEALNYRDKTNSNNDMYKMAVTAAISTLGAAFISWIIQAAL